MILSEILLNETFKKVRKIYHSVDWLIVKLEKLEKTIKKREREKESQIYDAISIYIYLKCI